MKTLTLFFALCFTLFITSCSQLDQETSPLTPQLSKDSGSSDYITFPYDYLATFPEIDSKWDETMSDDHWVVVTLGKTDKDYHHIFCEVIYTDLTEPVERESELFFVGKPENQRFAFHKQDYKSVYDIRVYAVYNYPTANDIPTHNEIPFPYNYMQNFRSIYVNAWDTKDEVISISAADDVLSSEQVFMQISAKEGNILVFVEQPASEFFDVPKYGNLNIFDVNLFGLNNFNVFDAE